ncbi:acyltransferase family protein [Fimbriiglobus ruber]|uniref:Acyltransferase 3 domain-containing protein n=1 Tax=Fimbriiglobus ruber TaxID=1908690 RepID=A0A225D7F5_9BACT|nr:acyltransferase [Fimbriiglobus ruber]OWK37530.1 hypothetical protein FRUB_06650 [Fimbriiglobus ruber]
MDAKHSRDDFLFLDSVRGIAAVVVVVWHQIVAFLPALKGGPTVPPPWVTMFYNGDFAVDLFFVLSGFVLSLSFVRGGGVESLRSAAVRRYFRLAVPVGASVFLSYLLLRFGLYYNRQAAVAAGFSPGYWLDVWNNFPASRSGALTEAVYKAFFAFEVPRTYNTYNNILWTMQIEFAGSLFVFAFHALFGGLRNRFWAYLVLAVVLICKGWVSGLEFLVGAAFCDLLGGRAPRPGAGALSVAVGAVCLVAVLAGMVIGGATPDWLTQKFGPPSSVTVERLAACHRTVGALLLLAGYTYSAWGRWLLTRRPLVFLGRISFPLYLVHILVELSLGCYVYLVCRQDGWSHLDAVLACAAVTIAVSIFLAWIGSWTVEPASIWLGRWVYATIFRRDQLPAYKLIEHAPETAAADRETARVRETARDKP